MGIAKVVRPISTVLFTLLVASVNVKAQSGGSSSDEMSALPVHPASQFQAASKVKATEARREGNWSVLARQPSQLCFLPGLGWQRIPSATKDTTDVTETQSADLKGEKESAFVGIVQPVHRRASGTGLNSNALCSGMFSSIRAPEVLRENYGEAIASHNPEHIGPGSQESTYPTSLINDSLINVIYNSTRRPRAMDTTFTGTVLWRPGELTGRAHVSPIELRREIRNAPDLMTRIKLRRVQNELEHKSRALISNAISRGIPEKHSNNVLGSRGTSSSLYGVRAHANGSKRFRSQHPNN